MFLWTSGFQNPLVHTDFDMFVDELTSVNESPGSRPTHKGEIEGDQIQAHTQGGN